MARNCRREPARVVAVSARQEERTRSLGQGQHRRTAAGELTGRSGDIVAGALHQIVQCRADVAERHDKGPAGSDDLALEPHDWLA